MVVDVAASGAEAGRGLGASSAGARGYKCTASPQDGALSPSGSSITQAPSSSEAGSSATPHNYTELQAGVWNLPDWGSPQSLGSQGSPCNEAGHRLEGSLAGACREPRQTLQCTASPQDGALSPSGSSITQVPSSSEAGSSATPHNYTELQAGVWNLPDWGSPQSLGSQGSPCNEAGHRLEGSVARACGEPRQTLRCTASPQDGALSPSGSSITQVPSSPEAGSSATPHNYTELQADVWSLQDWGSPQSLGSQGSLCNGALKFDKMHRDVADAVVAELQVDLQSATNRAIDLMSSWVSQKIAHARKGIEEGMHNSCVQGQEQQAKDREGLRNSHIELVWKFEQLQSRMDGRMQTLEDLCCRVADERRCSEPRAAGSAQVQEAWKVAEERKWRMKLDDLQVSLDRAS